MAAGFGCPDFWQIFGKMVFEGRFQESGKVRITAYLLVI
jgi:hypothetical protein